MFSADDGSNGRALWITDDTAVGTRLLKDIHPRAGGSGPVNFIQAGNLVYFAATDGTTGLEIRVTDGTSAGTRLVEDVQPGGATGGMVPLGLLDINGAPTGLALSSATVA